MGTADHGWLKKSLGGFRKKKEARPKEGKGRQAGSCKVQWEAPMHPNLRGDRWTEISTGTHRDA